MKNENKKCKKCNNNMNFLMKYKSEVDTYYCANCYRTVDILNGEEFANCDPCIAIEDVIYEIANKIPVEIYEESKIYKDTFLRILLDKKKKESLKNLMK